MCLGSSHAHGKNQWSLVSNSWNNAPKASVTWSSDTQREEKSQSLKSDTIYNAVYTDTQGERHLKIFFILWYTEPWYTGGRAKSKCPSWYNIHWYTLWESHSKIFHPLIHRALIHRWESKVKVSQLIQYTLIHTMGETLKNDSSSDTKSSDTQVGEQRVCTVQKRAEARRSAQRRAEARMYTIQYTQNGRWTHPW